MLLLWRNIITVWVEHFGDKFHFGWTEGIVSGEDEFSHKDPSLKCTVLRPPLVEYAGTKIFNTLAKYILTYLTTQKAHVMSASHSKKFSSDLGPQERDQGG